MNAFLDLLLPEALAFRDTVLPVAGPAVALVALLWCAVLQVKLSSAGGELRRLRRMVRGLEAAESQRAFEYMNRVSPESEASAAPRMQPGAGGDRRFTVAAE